MIRIALDNYFLQTLATVLGMSFTMIAVALGIMYLFETGLPLPAPVIFLVFAIGFIMGSVFFERRGAEHPWSLVGGAVASMGITFIVMSVVGGILFLANGGLNTMPMDTVLYSLSACMIVSMITLNFASYKLQYI
ncbi:MAG: heat-shock protein [Methanosarcinales archaeon]|nr:heat-shock protein [Methanosarcinales archaeon]